MKENLPPQDYHWDVDQAEWHVSPGHDAPVRRILDKVAEENGWQVDDDQQAEYEPEKSVESVNDTVDEAVDMDPFSIQGEMSGDGLILDFRAESMTAENMGSRDSSPYSDSETSGYAETGVATIESHSKLSEWRDNLTEIFFA